MGVIVKLKENELYQDGSTDDLYPVTTSKAVYVGQQNLDKELEDIREEINEANADVFIHGFWAEHIGTDGGPDGIAVFGTVIELKDGYDPEVIIHSRLNKSRTLFGQRINEGYKVLRCSEYDTKYYKKVNNVWNLLPVNTYYAPNHVNYSPFRKENLGYDPGTFDFKEILTYKNVPFEKEKSVTLAARCYAFLGESLPCTSIDFYMDEMPSNCCSYCTGSVSNTFTLQPNMSADEYDYIYILVPDNLKINKITQPDALNAPLGYLITRLLTFLYNSKDGTTRIVKYKMYRTTDKIYTRNSKRLTIS